MPRNQPLLKNSRTWSVRFAWTTSRLRTQHSSRTASTCTVVRLLRPADAHHSDPDFQACSALLLMLARAILAVGCILKWSLVKDDDVSCPKCKAKFSYLYTYRSLDGTLHDFPQVWCSVMMGQQCTRVCGCVCVWGGGGGVVCVWGGCLCVGVFSMLNKALRVLLR